MSEPEISKSAIQATQLTLIWQQSAGEHALDQLIKGLLMTMHSAAILTRENLSLLVGGGDGK